LYISCDSSKFENWQMHIHQMKFFFKKIHLVKGIINFSYVVYPYVINFWIIFYIDNLNSLRILISKQNWYPLGIMGKNDIGHFEK